MDDIRIEVTNMLNKYNESRFYVYALCEKNENEEIIPFYIGKGEGDRVWAHEDGEEKEREKIKDVDSDEDKDNEISEKYKKIKKLKSQGIEVEKIIIKWGMTGCSNLPEVMPFAWCIFVITAPQISVCIARLEDTEWL